MTARERLVGNERTVPLGHRRGDEPDHRVHRRHVLASVSGQLKPRRPLPPRHTLSVGRPGVSRILRLQRVEVPAALIGVPRLGLGGGRPNRCPCAAYLPLTCRNVMAPDSQPPTGMAYANELCKDSVHADLT